MLEETKWKDVYRLWEYNSYYFPKILTEPVSAETVFVKYEHGDSYFYGYDWLNHWDAADRKKLIQEDPVEFIYFSKPSNKGTIQTAQMLVEARSPEERAAIWIAATAMELENFQENKNLCHYAHQACIAACEFLRNRYYLWHHAMKKLVPDLMIPSPILENIVCKDVEPVIGLIQMNTMMLRTSWSILLYSSLENGETPNSSYRIRQQ